MQKGDDTWGMTAEVVLWHLGTMHTCVLHEHEQACIYVSIHNKKKIRTIENDIFIKAQEQEQATQNFHVK